MKISGNTRRALPIEGDLTHSRAGERYAQVVDALTTRAGSTGQVLVTSAGIDEGKTVTAINLAFAFHARRKSVLLAELSFVRPSFAAVFGRSPIKNGIEDAITGDTSLQSTVCVRNDNQLNVAMVNRPRRTNDLLVPSVRLDKLLSDARSLYEWTIFDGASLDSLSLVESLASNIGLVLLVARAGRTHSDLFEQAIKRINHPGTLVLLNECLEDESRAIATLKVF